MLQSSSEGGESVVSATTASKLPRKSLLPCPTKPKHTGNYILYYYDNQYSSVTAQPLIFLFIFQTCLV